MKYLILTSIVLNLMLLSISCSSPEGFRFLVIKQLSKIKKFLNLAQIEVFDSKGNNVAQGKEVMLLTTFLPYYGAYCTDGVADSFCHTLDEYGAWVRLDLGQIYNDILKIRIINRKGVNQYKIVPARIFLLDDQEELFDSYMIERESDYYDFEIEYSKKLHIQNKYCSMGNRFNRLNRIQFVKLQIEVITTTFLNLQQVEIFDVDGVNIAKGKDVSYSSVYNDDDYYSPKHLTDGIGDKIAHSLMNNLQEWFLIDLGKEYFNLKEIKITNRKLCCWERFSEAYIYLFDSKMNLVEHIPVRGARLIYQYYPSCQLSNLNTEL